MTDKQDFNIYENTLLEKIMTCPKFFRRELAIKYLDCIKIPPTKDFVNIVLEHF